MNHKYFWALFYYLQENHTDLYNIYFDTKETIEEFKNTLKVQEDYHRFIYDVIGMLYEKEGKGEMDIVTVIDFISDEVATMVVIDSCDSLYEFTDDEYPKFTKECEKVYEEYYDNLFDMLSEGYDSQYIQEEKFLLTKVKKKSRRSKKGKVK